MKRRAQNPAGHGAATSSSPKGGACQKRAGRQESRPSMQSRAGAATFLSPDLPASATRFGDEDVAAPSPAARAGCFRHR